MALVRAELGPEAMILGTRRVPEGIEITAALEVDEAVLPDIDNDPSFSPITARPGRATRAAVQSYPEVIDDGEAPLPQPPARQAASGARDLAHAGRAAFPLDGPPMDGRAFADRTNSALPRPAAQANGAAPSGASAAAFEPMQRAGTAGDSARRRPDRPLGTWRPPAHSPDLSKSAEKEHPAPVSGPQGARSQPGSAGTRSAFPTGAGTAERASMAVDVQRHVGVTQMDDDPPHYVAAEERPQPRLRAGESAASRRIAALSWHGVPSAIAGRLSAGPLPLALSIALPFAELDLNPDAPPLLLAGPPGAGKTLTTARLATRLVLAGCKPLVITADGRRAGATEQLAAFTRLLGLHLLVASTPAALQRALARRVEGQPVLIDAPGIDPFVASQIEELATLASSVAAVTALVCPAGLDPNEAADLAAIHCTHGATLLIANRLDTGRRLGGVLAAAAVGLALTEAGIGPGASDGLVCITPHILAARLNTFPDSSA